VCVVERFTSDVSFGPGDDKIPTAANVVHLHPTNRKRDDDNIIINILSVDERPVRGGGGTAAASRKSSMQSLSLSLSLSLRFLWFSLQSDCLTRSLVHYSSIYLFSFCFFFFVFRFEDREGFNNRLVIVFWHLIARPLIIRTQLRNIWHL